MPPATGNFRMQSKRFMLTYPQCNLTIQQVYDSVHNKYPIKWARICIEEHQDGTPHLHAAVELTKKPNIRQANAFDIEGFHPNVEPSRNWPATQNYCKKGSNYEDFDNRDVDDSVEESNLYELAATMQRSEFMHYARTHKVPFGYATDAWNTRESIFTINASTTGLESLGTIRSDLDAYTIDETDRRSHVIIGPSGIGKTTWAKRECAKPALFVTHTDGLRKLGDHHKSIVFDDMSFLHIPREAQIQLVDRDCPRQIHVRYGTADIPAGIQKIFTSNVQIFDTGDQAINRRVNVKRFPQNEINFIN